MTKFRVGGFDDAAALTILENIIKERSPLLDHGFFALNNQEKVTKSELELEQSVKPKSQ